MASREDQQGLLTIGMFSRASLLSVKQLRAYHEAGVLEPAAVDPQSGYRSYHWSQLTDAAVIRQLRAVDLPLAQVREIVTSSDPDVTRDVLELHLETMQSRLEEVAQAVGVLQDAVEHPALHTPVHVRHVEATHVLALTGKVSEADFATFLGDAFPQLEKTAAQLDVIPSGPCGGLYPHEIADEIEEVTAYLPIPSSPPTARQLIDARRSPVTATTLPASEMVVAVHQGSYDTIGETYRLLGTWVAKNAATTRISVSGDGRGRAREHHRRHHQHPQADEGRERAEPGRNTHLHPVHLPDRNDPGNCREPEHHRRRH